MRWTTIGILLFLGAALGLPIWFLTPPLWVGPPPEGQVYTARQPLSQPARAGQRAFGGGCAGCHGADGSGGAGPALNDMVFARDFLEAKELHDAVTMSIPGHEGLAEAIAGGDARERFNDIELMGKYLRELRRHRTGGPR